jgi:hypothetical protein
MTESPHMSSGYRFRAHRLIPDGAAAMAWDPLRDAIVGLSDAINLMEDVEACGYGLPIEPEPGEDGLVPF